WPAGQGELTIPTKLMRVILSTSRLHFSYSDEKNLTKSDLNKVLLAQKVAAEREATSGPDAFYQNACLASTTTKKYIRNWRQRHLNPFFLKNKNFQRIEFIAGLDPDDKYTKLKLILLN